MGAPHRCNRAHSRSINTPEVNYEHHHQLQVQGSISTQRLIGWLSAFAAGLLIGVPVALGIARGLTSFLKSELFQVSAMDPIAFITACFVVSAMTIAAAWIPARRAASIDPLIALRCE